MVDPLEVINTCARVIDFCSRLKDVGLENKVFSRLIQRVREDVEEAFRLMRKPEVQAHFEADPDKEKRVNGTILSVKTAINNIARFVEALRVQKEREGTIGMINRFEWVLRHQSKLNSRQLELDTCHKSLLQSINAMQMWELFPPTRSIEIGPTGSILLPPRARLRMRREKMPENLIDLDDERHVIPGQQDCNCQNLGSGAFGPSAITLVEPDVPALAELPDADVKQFRKAPIKTVEVVSVEELIDSSLQGPLVITNDAVPFNNTHLRPNGFQEVQSKSRMSGNVESPFEDGLILADELPERPKSSLASSGPISMPSSMCSDVSDSRHSRSKSSTNIVLEFEWETSPSFSDLVESALPQLQICRPRLSRYRKKRASLAKVQLKSEPEFDHVDEGNDVNCQLPASVAETNTIVREEQIDNEKILLVRPRSCQEDIRKRRAKQDLVLSGL